MVHKIKMIDLNKKGVIILTHYRAGGTLLRQIIERTLHHIQGINTEEIGEIDFIEGSYENDTKVDYSALLKTTFETFDNGYKVIQLNNPLVISYLFAINYFTYLDKNFSVIHLERKNYKKSLLSLPLWEYYLNFKTENNLVNSDSTMEMFEKHCIDNPIGYEDIYTGIHFAAPNAYNYRNYLDYQLMLQTNRLHLNRYIKTKYNLFSIKYEDFEADPTQKFFNLFSNLYNKDFTKEILNQNLKELKKTGKLNYKNDNYIDYFDCKVKEVFKYWKIE